MKRAVIVFFTLMSIFWLKLMAMEAQVAFLPDVLYQLKPGKYTLNAELVIVMQNYHEIKLEDLKDEIVREYVLLKFAELPRQEKIAVCKNLINTELTPTTIYLHLPQEIKKQKFCKISSGNHIFCVPTHALEHITD